MIEEIKAQLAQNTLDMAREPDEIFYQIERSVLLALLRVCKRGGIE